MHSFARWTSVVAMADQNEKYELKPETELRCEVPNDGELKVVLEVGSAEIFGVEIAANREYSFQDSNIAIFTWYGCKLSISSSKAVIYVSEDTPMVSYVNTHMQLEAKRDYALANNEFGPRVLLTGPGKSTTARILSAYACRLDRTPLYIDLDVCQTSMTVPGTISAIPLDKFSLNVQEGFDSFNPLTYYVGHSSAKEVEEHTALYDDMTSILAEKVNNRLEKDIELKSSGFFINTCSIDNFETLVKCVKTFSTDIVLVLGNDKLYSQLSQELKNDDVMVVKLPSSGGRVIRNRESKNRLRQARINEYFYGNITSMSSPINFSPTRIDIQISTMKFIRSRPPISEGMSLIGETKSGANAGYDTELIRITPQKDLLENCFVAVLHPLKEGDTSAIGDDGIPQNLLKSNVAGFIYIVEMDIEQDTMTILSPSSGPLPSIYLLVGSIKGSL